MKKLFLALLGTVLLASCSHDNEASVDFNDQDANANSMFQKDPIDQTLKDLYVNMLNSKSYINYENARKAFDAKLGTAIPASEITTSAKVLNWVSKNLSQTTFTSYAAAVAEHDNVVALSATAIQANLGFYNYLNGTAPGTLVPILDEMEPVTTGCEACMKSFKNCTSVANSEYTNSIQAASASFLNGGSSLSGYANDVDHALYVRNQARASCRYSFVRCCSGGS